jgi:uncharacterized small protein (DUF1192 family)
MDWEDVRTKAKPVPALGEPLAALSLAELEARIALLSLEIERVEAELAAKRAHESAAAALFQR